MNDVWARIEAAAANASLRFDLRPPAREAEIRAAERTIGIDFPEGFRASLLVHDGQELDDGEPDPFDWLPGHPRLASLERIVSGWQEECATYETQHAGESPEVIADGRLHHFLWHPRRIPIAGNAWWDQDNTYLDFFPGPHGVPGQVVVFGKGVFGEVHGTSFRAALELFANALASGEWVVRDGRCVSRNKRFGSWAKYATSKGIV